MTERFINTSIFNSDIFFSDQSWLGAIKINHYQAITVGWNMLLVAIPWLLIWYLLKYWKKERISSWSNRLWAAMIFFIWLLFIPNTAYIITDLRHISGYCPDDPYYLVCPNRVWMIFFFFTYAAVGWVAMVKILQAAQKWIADLLSETCGKIFIFSIIPLISLGLLLGLVNRWNSWEFFIQPYSIYTSILTYFTDMIYFINWAVITGFLFILFWAGDYLFKNDIDKG